MASSITLLIAVLAYHCAALAALLVWKSNLRALPLFLATLGLHMAANLLEQSGLAIHWLTGAIGALYGPLVYLFVREAAFADQKIGWRDSYLALPFLIAIFLPVSGAYKPIIIVVTLALSVAACLHIVLRFRKAAREARAIPDLARMDWISWATLGFIAIAAFDVIRIILETSGVLVLPTDAGFAVTLTGLLVLTGWLAWGAFEHLRRGGPLERSEQALATAEARLATADHKAHFTAITQTVESRQLYLEPGLKLAELADAAALTPREASEAINACYQANFSAFINSYRARHARALIEQKDAATLLSIAMDAGFSSKTAFNTFFKRETGFTPSEFAHQVRHHDQERSTS